MIFLLDRGSSSLYIFSIIRSGLYPGTITSVSSLPSQFLFALWLIMKSRCSFSISLSNSSSWANEVAACIFCSSLQTLSLQRSLTLSATSLVVQSMLANSFLTSSSMFYFGRSGPQPVSAVFFLMLSTTRLCYFKSSVTLFDGSLS